MKRRRCEGISGRFDFSPGSRCPLSGGFTVISSVYCYGFLYAYYSSVHSSHLCYLALREIYYFRLGKVDIKKG